MFDVPWTQEAGKTYYYLPRDPTPENPTWALLELEQNPSSDCAFHGSSGQLACSRRYFFGVYLEVDNCCIGCLNGGSCLSSGVCHCPLGYAGDDCSRKNYI